IHGLLLLLAVAVVPGLLTKIPLAALAAVLLHVGYKLAPISLFVRMFRRGWDQFVPFVVTVLAILLSDLLTGVAIGMGFSVFYILRANLATPYFMHKMDMHEEDSRPLVHIELSENVTFLNKASVNKALHQIPSGSRVQIDGSHATYIDRDVLELIEEFCEGAPSRGIEVELTRVPASDAPPAQRRAEGRSDHVEGFRKRGLAERKDPSSVG
ncbi:MAG: hypothetical protein AB1Z98_19380, partial [Nannocystaceae bacterium]